MSEKENIREIIVIGRGAESNFVANDGSVSRQHAQIIDYGTYYTVVDLGSTNGTFVNGRRVASETTLHSGDELKVGNVVVPWEQLVQPPQKQKKAKVLLAILIPVIAMLLIGGVVGAYFIWWHGKDTIKELNKENEKAAIELKHQQEQIKENEVKSDEEKNKLEEQINAEKDKARKDKEETNKKAQEEIDKARRDVEKAQNDAKKAQEQANKAKEALEEEEAFSACKTIHEYEAYIKNYPNGKHFNEAQKKIEELKKDEDQKQKKTVQIQDQQAKKDKEAEALEQRYKELLTRINKLSSLQLQRACYDLEINFAPGTSENTYKTALLKEAEKVRKDSDGLKKIENVIRKYIK